MIRQKIFVYGDVQGVGFRYRAFYTAKEYGLTGYVKNNPDGAVEMEVQGELEKIDLFLQQVGQGTYISIQDVRRREIPILEERSFIISDYY